MTLLTVATAPLDPLNVEALAHLEPDAVPWLVASLLADLAFYFLLIPVALGLGGHLVRWAGVAYALLGAVGAGLLLWHWPASLYAADAERFVRITRLVYFDLWNGIGALTAAVWWVGLAWRSPPAQGRFAAFTLALGILSLLDALSFRLFPVEAARWVLVPLLVLLAVWPSLAALGPLREARPRP